MTLRTALVRLCLVAAVAALLVEVPTLLLRRKALRARRGGVPVLVNRVYKSAQRTFVVLGPSSISDHPGALVLWDKSKVSSVLLGPPEPVTEGVGGIRRRILSRQPSDFHSWKNGFLYGHLGQTPADMDLAYEEVSIGERAFPAWKVTSPTAQTGGERWAIHLHGLGGARNQVLRGLPVFARNGYHSLVPSYDTSLDVKPRRKQSTLGFGEWRAIAAAEDYAASQGATDIVYVGWSFGALLALRVRHEKPSPLVKGLVLISPALDWHRIIPRAMRDAGLPNLIVRLVMARFNGVIPRWGTPQAAWEEENRFLSSIAPLPLLVTHGEADTTVPLDQARETIQGLLCPVKFVNFPRAHHGLEWNSNPTLWESTVEEWLNSSYLGVSPPERSAGQPRSEL